MLTADDDHGYADGGMPLIPYMVETLIARSPWANIAILAVTSVVSIMAMSGGISDEVLSSMILDGWNLDGFAGHLLLHGGWIHLIGNMLYLFVFGNAVCGVMSQVGYTILYLGLGSAAAAAHVFFDGSPAIGASGAVSGIMGVYLAIYPVNRVHCCWLWALRGGTFEVPGWVIIGFYFVLDLIGAFGSGGHVAHWAHVGGTVAGFVVGLVLLKAGLVIVGDYDNRTALDYFTGRER